MLETADVYARSLRDIRCRTPQVPFYSTAYGRWLTDQDVLDINYWITNLVSPVLFGTAVQGVLEDSPQQKIFLEIGPHSALRGPLRQCFQASSDGKNASYIPTLVRDADSYESLLNTVGNLHCNGVTVDLTAVIPRGNVLTDLPSYRWHYETIWKESRVSKDWRFRKFPRHDLLGAPVLENNQLEPVWRNVLRLEDVPWICDHQVGSNIVFPAAAYIAAAGEASRQITGTDSYTVRNVSIMAAMVLHEGGPTDIMTSLKPHRSTDAQASTWYDFTISSFHNNTWVRHCSGQVRGGTGESHIIPELATYPRDVSSQRWYQTSKRVGLNYGPSFSRLAQISADIYQPYAAATIPLGPSIPGSAYPIHPASLDMLLQALNLAHSNGQPRKFTTVYLPTYIKELSVWPTYSDMLINVDVDPTKSIKGSVVGLADGEIVVQGHGLEMSPLEENLDISNDELYSGAQLEWRPHLRFLDMAKLFSTTRDVSHIQKIMEEITFLAIAEIAQNLASIRGKRPHLEKYRNWLLSMTSAMQRGSHRFLHGIETYRYLQSSQRRERMASLLGSIEADQSAPYAFGAATAIIRIFEELPNIIEDKVSSLELLLKDNVLSQYYNYGEMFDHKPFLEHLAHEKPTLNILEIGAGTGSTTIQILRNLYSDNNERMYSSYTFTDISEGFFPAAKERLQEFSSINYMTFDITKDPIEQGLQADFYDLIVANNVIHATSSLQQSLQNIRKVLHPRGFLMLQELCCDTTYTPFVMGTFEGWWLGESDGRSQTPFVKPERWDRELKMAGFSGTDVVVLDHPSPYSLNALLLTSARSITPRMEKITLLVRSRKTPVVNQIMTTLVQQGIKVDFCEVHEVAPPDQMVISLLDVDGPFLFDISEDDFRLLVHFLTNLKSQKLLWLTKPSQVRSADPRYAPILGIARNARLELGLDFATLEADRMDSKSLDILPSFVEKYRHDAASSGDVDYEYALIEGVVRIGRFHWSSVLSSLSEPLASSASRKLEIGKKGLLQSLHWEQQTPGQLPEDAIMVDIQAVGMNFRVRSPHSFLEEILIH
jgi:SAM-dependent methyltransferase